jgi:lipopolysaccharide biosynthesis glycosyltransferase
MINIFDTWIKSDLRPNKEFLILGKGPSLDLESNIIRSKYISIGINHVSAKYKVEIAHVIDLEVLIDCGDLIFNNADYLLMPWYPNLNFKPYFKNLEELVDVFQIINKFRQSNRLLTYNRANGLSQPPGGGVTILPRYFSGDTLFQLLSKLGEKKIFSIGLDGGDTYSAQFGGLKPLENGRKSFNEQFIEINETSKKLASELVRIGDLEPINVYVGSQEEQRIPALVLKDSIMQNTHHPVFFNLLCDSIIEFKMPDDPRNRPRTPFSFQRFMIPSLAKGKAFYLDSDMQVFGDMAELLELDFEDSEVIACYGMDMYGHWKGSQYAVLLMDCSKIKWDIHSVVKDLDAGVLNYDDLMFKFKLARITHKIPPTWNSLDLYDQKTTKLLHYTDMAKQPWKHSNHPFEAIWVQGLKEAIKNKTINISDYEAACQLGNVRNVLQTSTKKLISVEYARLNQKLHQERSDYGAHGHRHAAVLSELAKRIGARHLLDYGCGKQTLKGALSGICVKGYDPAIHGLNEIPEPADIVYCGDVLEHIELEFLDNVLDDLKRVTLRIGVLVIHTGPSTKTLADGRNAHLIQESFDWWKPLIEKRFGIANVRVSGSELFLVVVPKQ